MITAPVSIASRVAPRRGLPSLSGSATRVPSGNSARTSPRSSTARDVSIASASEEPRRTGKPPSAMNRRPRQPVKSSALPMKCSRRRTTAATKKASQKLLWLGAITTGPDAGMCSVPVAVRPKNSFISGTRSRRTRKYRTGLLPLVRASRCASSWVSPTSGVQAGRFAQRRIRRRRGPQRAPPPTTEHDGDHDVDHDEDGVRDVVAGRAVLLRVDERLGEPCVGQDVPGGDEEQ